MSNTSGARLSNIVAPAFYPVHWDIQDGKHTYYDLYGGRGSTKSSFISAELVLGVMQDPLANAIVFRKVLSTIGTSVFEQCLWAIDALGVNELWRAKTSPYKLTYRPTGQVILFRGLDKAKKLKSVKVAHGYLKYLWLEELDEFAGPEEVRSVQQSVMRGGSKFVVFKSFNPPLSRINWANEYVQTPRRAALRHKSCYTEVPPEWLGEQFFDDAEALKETNPRAYMHEYLGIPVGTGGNVFENLELRDISDEEIKGFDRIYQGIDWGWYPDPFAFVRLHYDKAREKIYLIDELYANKWTNEKTAKWIKRKRYNDFPVTCDSAEPKSITDYREMGLSAWGAIKGPGSVDYGMKWLQRRKIVIDRRRTPNAYEEFVSYEYERTKDGEIISGYPDANNHTIDAVRYAMERVFNRMGSTA